MRDLGRQLAEMPEEQRLLLAFTSAGSTADIMRLVAETSDDDLDQPGGRGRRDAGGSDR